MCTRADKVGKARGPWEGQERMSPRESDVQAESYGLRGNKRVGLTMEPALAKPRGKVARRAIRVVRRHMGGGAPARGISQTLKKFWSSLREFGLCPEGKRAGITEPSARRQESDVLL